MKIKLYQIDTFTNRIFSGNPAAVCPLENWPEDSVLQNIAAENNLAETAYFVPTNQGFHIRWFTPEVEVDLCGHATLASAYVLFNFLAYPHAIVSFQSRSGVLTVSKNEDWYTLNFPVDTLRRTEVMDKYIDFFEKTPLEAYLGKSDLM